MLVVSKSDLSLSHTIDLESFGPLLPEYELLVVAVARLKNSSGLSGPSRDGDVGGWQT